MTELDVEFCRSQFPQFRNPDTAAWAFCENAGGSYAPDPVVERMERYFRELKSQPYYPHAMAAELGRGMDESTEKLAAAINADPDEIVLGASSTINVYVAANALRSEIEPGDQIVLVACASAHREAAFEACHFLIDWLKTKAPFWKLEDTPDGGKWVDARDSDEDAAARWATE